VSRLAYVVGPEQIEQGLRARLEAPDCSLTERLRYTSALASMALAKDDPETALQHAVATLDLAGQADAPQETTSAWYGLGNTLYQCGAFQPAEQAYAECVDRALDEGSVALAAQGMAGLGHTHFMRRQSDRAIDAYTTAGALWNKLGLTHGEVYALTWHAEARAQKGELPQALAQLERAQALCAAVHPSQADAYQGMKAELLQRKAAIHGQAKQRQQEKECRAEAEKLGASAPASDHP
jgi:tetratricopeptide (TPR) repeat protein